MDLDQVDGEAETNNGASPQQPRGQQDSAAPQQPRGQQDSANDEEVVVHHFDPKLNTFVPRVEQGQGGQVDSDEFDYGTEEAGSRDGLPHPGLRLAPVLEASGARQHLTSLPEDLYQVILLVHLFVSLLRIFL